MRTYEEIAARLAGWLPEYADAAQREGWDLFTCSDSTSDVQVQRIDDPEELEQISPGARHLPSDNAALVIVALGKDPHHGRARNILFQHFPAEWQNMLKALERFRGDPQ